MKPKLNWIIILYLLFLGLAACWCFSARILEPNDIYGLWVYGTENGFVVTVHFSPRVTDQYGHATVENADIPLLSSENMFKLMTGLWLQKNHYGQRIFTLNEFSRLAKHFKPWPKPPVIPELNDVVIPGPNELPVIEDPNTLKIRASMTSKYYHRPDCECRYCSDTMILFDVIIAIDLGKIACPYCKPIFYTGD